MARQKRTPPKPPIDTAPTQPKLPDNKFPVVVKNKGGRPSEYSDYVAGIILSGIKDGKTLISICANDGMPERQTFLNWCEKRPELFAAYRRARGEQMDYWAEDMVMQSEIANPVDYKVVDLRIKTKMWLMARLKSQTYGDRMIQEVTGANGGPIQTATLTINAADLDPDARDALRSALLLSRKEGE